VTLGGSFGQPKNISTIIAAQSALLSFANTQAQFTSLLASSAVATTFETQRLSFGQTLSPVTNFSINSQTSMSPFAGWSVQANMAVNERLLPRDTAFYFISPGLIVSEVQTLAALALEVLQAQLTPHEGLMLIQAPIIATSSSALAVKEHLVIGPNLTLASNILLNVSSLTDISATGTNLQAQTNFQIQYTLDQSSAANLNASSIIPNVASNMDMAGLSDMSSGCFIDPTVKIHHNQLISAVITSKKSQSIIYAQGNFVSSDS
jgi:hypothetical protein